jgi:hypothetical protein
MVEEDLVVEEEDEVVKEGLEEEDEVEEAYNE